MKKSVDSILDGHKIHLHPEKSAIWREIKDCYPIHIEIGATNKCNHDCVFCALDFAIGKTDINRDVMINALKDMAEPKEKCELIIKYQGRSAVYNDRVNSVMFGGEGEPTMHKDLGLFIQKAKEYGLDVALTTNGTRFDKTLQEQCLPYLSWVKFSVDAGTPETYKKVHRVSEKQFEILMKNISDSVQLKKQKGLDATIGTQFLITSMNANETEATILIERLREINPDYLSVKPYSDHPRSQKNLEVDSESYDKLEKTFNDLRGKVDFNIEFRRATIERIQEGNTYSECYGLPFISLIDSKGNVLPCNLFYDIEKFIYGNLYENSFSEIWGGNKRKEVLSRLKGKELGDCRRGCRCDAGNRYLNRLKNPQIHDNFT